MGIPKFYRWLSERYPLLNMPVTATEAPPEIDNLYLDMNGIIHNCTHANDPSLRLTETEMVLRIFMYLDKLIHITKPKKLIFLAIDGVAPRAKMNQQRSRRFKSALERIQREAEAESKGEATPDEYKFDSNCITPGTEFMGRLGKHLHFFLRKKMSEDPVWQQPLVIFSGHDVPGEGEHKIMEYIRWQKRRPDYTSNQRHCMYGLDADLIMLSLVTHEPHFCLLREVVSFTGKTRGQPSRETLSNPCAQNFILFQIGLLREYLEFEFSAALSDKQLNFSVDVERVIDDVVLFCMLVGNDFLPALPTLDIAEGALNKLIDTYKRLLPQLGGYLTHAGELNHSRLQVLLGSIADDELATLEERAADTEWFESKRQKRGRNGAGRDGARSGDRGSGSNGSLKASSSRGVLSSSTDHVPAAAAIGSFSGGTFMSGVYQVLEDLEGALDEEGNAGQPLLSPSAVAVAVPLNSVLEDLGELEPEEEQQDKGPTMMSKEARNLFLNGGGQEALAAWKVKYYTEKLELPDASARWTSEVVQHYIRGLHWVLQYYYRGVASWDWFYPYHYAPMAQDMRQLADIDVSFSRGRPFRPYEQLLAVMPPASASLLPPAFRWLMTEARSPILDFYPEKFDVDMEGKRAEWEGIVKVPFVSEARLLEAVASIPLDRLSADERRRNQPGDMLVLEHTAGWHEQEHCDSTLPQHFASIQHAHSVCRQVPPPDPLPSDERGFVPVLAKGTMTGKRNPPGFPTLKTMSDLAVELKLAGVNVFGNPSKKDSLILVLPDVRNSITADAAAPLLRGMLCGRVYVKWPYLQEAQIMAVSDAKERVDVQGITQHAPEEAAKWQMLSGQTKNMFLTKTGIDIGALPVILDVRVCTGYKREVDGSIRKEYAKELAPYPLQAVLQSRPRPPPGFSDPDAAKAVVLQPGSKAVWVGANYFGCVATVLADPSTKITGKGAKQGSYYVRVQPVHPELLVLESRARQVVQQYAPHYVLSGQAARQLNVNPRLLGRLTGNIWVNDSNGDRVDVGLAVKNAKQALCVPVMCKPNNEGTGWLYSAALVDLVRQYKAAFPSIFAALDPSRGGVGGMGAGEDGERQKLRAADLFPHAPPDQHDTLLQQVASWLKGHVSSKYPLVASSTLQASEAAVDRLQVMLPGLLPLGTAAVGPVELEQVHSSLLLPPHDPAAPQSVLTGGYFEPGDRVVVVTGTGAPAFGARGTVIGVMPSGVELLLDDEYAGGTTLKGRLRGPRGTYLPPEQLLNVTRQHPVHYVGPKPRVAAKPSKSQRMQQRTAGTGSTGPAGVTPASSAATFVVRPLIEVAPWLKGKQLQVLQPGQGRAVPPTTVGMPDGAVVAHAAGRAQLAKEQPPAVGQSVRPGSKLLQLLKQQGNMPPPPQPMFPMHQQQQQQPVAAISNGSLPEHKAPPKPGQALLRQLQKGMMAGGTQQQRPAAASDMVGQQAGGSAAAVAAAMAGLQQLEVGAGAAAGGVVPIDGPPSLSSGANLLALLKRNTSTSSAGAGVNTQHSQYGQQQEALERQRPQQVAAVRSHTSGVRVKVVPRLTHTTQSDHYQQQPNARSQAVAHADRLALQVQQQPENLGNTEVQQLKKGMSSKRNKQAVALADATSSCGLAAVTAAPSATPPRAINTSQAEGDEAGAAGSRSHSSRLGDGATAAAVQNHAGGRAHSPIVPTPPAMLNGSSSSSSGGGGSSRQQQAPRTPPAGAGAGLMAQKQDRGDKERIARLPEPGARGFAMGRGQRLAGVAAQQSAARIAGPGSSSALSAASQQGHGVCNVPLPPEPFAQGISVPHGQHLPATPSDAAAKVACGSGGLLMQQPLSQQLALPPADQLALVGSPTQHGNQRAEPPGDRPVPAASNIPAESGQLLMRMLQRGDSRGNPLAQQPRLVQPWQPSEISDQHPQQQQQQEALMSTPVCSLPSQADVPTVAGATAANSTAACNLLRRLQSKSSQGMSTS